MEIGVHAAADDDTGEGVGAYASGQGDSRFPKLRNIRWEGVKCKTSKRVHIEP